MILQKNHKKLPVFSNKIRTKPLIRNMRHSSLGGNVLDVCVKLYNWKISIKQDIAVQKLKVKKLALNLSFL